ncbi:MAG: hypothetical protein R3B90_20715 [Planctomycetaceae bacterium]
MSTTVGTTSFSGSILRRHLLAVSGAVALVAASWSVLEAPTQRGIAALVSLLLAGGVGLIWLRQRLSAQDGILTQLVEFSAVPDAAIQLRPVDELSAIGLGWNHLVNVSRRFRLLSQIEQKVDASLSDRKISDTERLLGCLPDGIAITDLTGNVTIANEAAGGTAGSRQPRRVP